MSARYESAEWLELSGLPEKLNAIRANGWLLFKKVVELDCRLHRSPEAVESSLGELGERCGLAPEKVAHILEALRRKKVLACFIPDNPDEPGLIQIRIPIKTPRSPEDVARRAADPHLRDPTGFRYVKPPEARDLDLQKVQTILDLYLNLLSQKMNSFIVEEVEILAQRFPLEKIEHTIRRAADYEIRSIGWVAKELIRDAKRGAEKQAEPR